MSSESARRREKKVKRREWLDRRGGKGSVWVASLRPAHTGDWGSFFVVSGADVCALTGRTRADRRVVLSFPFLPFSPRGKALLEFLEVAADTEVTKACFKPLEGASDPG